MLAGFGKMSHGYAADHSMAKYYPYATHAQVLRDHSGFEWLAVVDPDPQAREDAKSHWNVATAVAQIKHLKIQSEVEVLILATPPDSRLELLSQFPNLKAVLVEKPIGTTLEQGQEFVKYCEKHKIMCLVNFWRRADKSFNSLLGSGLENQIGKIQLAHAVYGNGLLNNGVHVVDFLRMMLGEVKGSRVETHQPAAPGSPIPGDMSPMFSLDFESGLTVPVQPLQFSYYREIGFEFWGQNGVLTIRNEGLTIQVHQRESNRAMANENEVAFDRFETIPTTVGNALYDMYENLHATLMGKARLCSTGESALVTAEWVERIQCESGYV